MKTNNLIYKISKTAPNGERWEIKISLNDECGNGHQDFSITGAAWEKGNPKTDNYLLHGGACGDEIASLWPEYSIFNTLHLCDCKGRPMYAAENGRYHFTNTSFEVGRDYLRLTTEEAKELIPYTSDGETFRYKLESLGVLERWENEANKAIKLLEKLTGDEFVNDSKRYHYTPLSDDEKTNFEQREKAGVFTAEKMAEKKQNAINATNEKLAAEELAKVDKMRNFANAKEKAIYAILAAGLPLQNCIFYDHSQSCKFNWKSWEVLVPDDVFNAFVENNKIDGFKFEIETKK